MDMNITPEIAPPTVLANGITVQTMDGMGPMCGPMVHTGGYIGGMGQMGQMGQMRQMVHMGGMGDYMGGMGPMVRMGPITQFM